MANQQAWAEGWQLGADAAQQYRQNKTNLEQQERELNVHDLLSQRTTALEKINSLDKADPDYQNAYQKAHSTLNDINSNIIDAYHPAKSPGAIEKYGHLLTDHLNLTSPQKRAQAAAAAAQQKTDALSKQTDQQIAASPLTSIQKLELQVDAINRNPSLDDEGKKRAIDKLYGITPYMKPDNRQYKLLDGTIRSFNVNDPEEKAKIPEGASEIAKVNPTANTRQHEAYLQYQLDHPDYKGTEIQWVAEQRRLGAPSTSLGNEGLEAYSKSHGFESFGKLPPEYQEKVMDYNIRKQALDKAYPTAVTTTSLKQNFQNQWVPVTETNYKTPQGALTLRDPLWFLASPVPAPNDAVQQRGKNGEPTTPVRSTASTPIYTAGKPKGLVSPGNIDINNRPVVPNGDGSSTVYSMGIESDGKHYLIPRVSDGKDGQPPHIMSEDEAKTYFQKYGEHLGQFDSDEAADAYGRKALHEQQASMHHVNGRTTVPDVKELKREAAARAPKAAGSGASSTKPKVLVGNPLFAGKSKLYDDALAAYNGAAQRVETMDKNARDANGGDQQAMLSLVANHIGMTLGAQKGARINQAVWNEAVESAPGLDKLYAKIGHFDNEGYWVFDGSWVPKGGVNLTGGQIKSMVKLAHEQEGTFRNNLGRVESQLNSGVTNPSTSQVNAGTPSNDSQASRGTVSIKKAKLKEAYKGMTDDQIKAEIEKHHYTAVP